MQGPATEPEQKIWSTLRLHTHYTSRYMLSKPFFCFLLALHIPLTYFSANQSFFQFSGVLRTVIVFQIVTFTFYCLGKLVFRRNIYATAIACAPLIFYWFMKIDMEYALFATAVGTASLFLLGRFLDHQKLITFLNVCMLAVFLQPVSQIAMQMTSKKLMEVDYTLLKEDKPALALGDPILKRQGELPSILHITLDAYASDLVLAEVMGVDNSEFSSALEGLGFTVFRNAVAPYNQTILTMPAIFSGDYLSLPRVASLSRSGRFRELGHLWVAGYVHETLNKFGYMFAYNRTGFFRHKYPKDARISEGEVSDKGLSSFESEFILNRGLMFELSVKPRLSKFLDYFRTTKPSSLKNSSAQPSSDPQPPVITLLKSSFGDDFVAGLESPFFYSLHAIAPHPPFTISRDGDKTTIWENNFGSISGGSHAHKMKPELQKQYSNGYAEKLLYTNRTTLGYVKRVIENSGQPLIIVIHGDHGSGVLLDVNSPENSCLRERFLPYLAIYSSSPEISERLQQYSSTRFNLINIYRVIFDEIFEQEIPLEKSESKFVSYANSNKFTDVNEVELERKCNIPW